MSIETQFSRIEANRNTIRAKLVELGMATNTDKLDTLAQAIEGLVNRGAVSVTVQEGDTYTIPAGYHNGSGTVSGVAGGGNYSLQSKSVTPTKKQQSITPDNGYYGLSDITVAPIPDAYQNVTSVTASASDVLTGKVYVTKEGTITTGTMPNNGTINKSLGVTTISYTIPKGYHSGSGMVTITLETKDVIPTKSEQKITPASGKVLSQVTVAPIPDAYQDITGVTATADKVLTGSSFVSAEGSTVEGTMPNRAAVSKTLDTGATSYTIPAGYHNGAGKVQITVEDLTITPTKLIQTIMPTTGAQGRGGGTVHGTVTVNPIPDKYQDVTPVTANADNVLTGKVIVNAEGKVVNGAMPNNEAFSKVLKNTATESECTIPAGYHNGSGKISVSSEPVTVDMNDYKDLKEPYDMTTDDWTTGDLSFANKITILPLDGNYHDVSEVTAKAENVLYGKKIVTSDGTVITGTMPNNGAEDIFLRPNNPVYEILEGYYEPTSMISVASTEKNVEPTKEVQTIEATNLYFNKIIVNKIPDEYQDVSKVDTIPSHVLEGDIFVDNDGEVMEGTMPNNGDVSNTIDGLTTTFVTIAAGYTTGGTISLTDDIEQRLAAI